MSLGKLASLLVLLLPLCATAASRLYVANGSEQHVSVIDASSGQVTTKIAVGDGPGAMAADPAGSRIYVANAYSNTVSVIDTASNSVVATIPVEIFPAALAVNSDGTFVYVTNSRSDTVSVVSAASGAAIAPIPVSHGPQGIVIDPNGRWVYSLATNDRYISVIDAATNVVVDTISAGGGPQHAVFTADGTLMLISGSDGIYVYDPSRKTVQQTLPVASLGVFHVMQIVVDSSKGALYAVALADVVTGSSAVLVLDPATFAVTRRIAVGAFSSHAALDPATSRLYVTNQGDGTVSVIDTSTQTVIDGIPVGPNPRSIVAVDVSVAPAPVSVVEFHNASLDHYFISWIAKEIHDLDTGVHPGWARTGRSFKAYPTAQAGTSPLCRYYIPPALGDSHFFGRGAAECNATGQKNPTFVLEDSAFMQMVLPAGGVCPGPTDEVYRVFSNRPDANHRYTTDKAVRDQMMAKGWLGEGDGPNLVVMCAPR